MAKKRFSAKWTEASLVEAENYARQLEQTDLLKRELRDTYGANVDSNVKRIIAGPNKNCAYCGKTHKKGQCLAYGRTCDLCKKLHHFASVCKSTNSNRGTGSREALEAVAEADLIITEVEAAHNVAAAHLAAAAAPIAVPTRVLEK